MATDVNLAHYSGNPADSAKDAVRLLIGDTKDPYRFLDAEIEFFLTNASDDPQAAAQSIIAVSMAGAAATAGTRTIGKTTIEDRRTSAFKEGLAALQATSPVGGTGATVELFDRTHTTPSIFDTGMMDAPGTNLPGWDPDDTTG